MIRIDMTVQEFREFTESPGWILIRQLLEDRIQGYREELETAVVHSVEGRDNVRRLQLAIEESKALIDWPNLIIADAVEAGTDHIKFPTEEDEDELA